MSSASITTCPLTASSTPMCRQGNSAVPIGRLVRRSSVALSSAPFRADIAGVCPQGGG
jgi:hypothetical protein